MRGVQVMLQQGSNLAYRMIDLTGRKIDLPHHGGWSGRHIRLGGRHTEAGRIQGLQDTVVQISLDPFPFLFEDRVSTLKSPYGHLRALIHD
jgi:hypothetical protein